MNSRLSRVRNPLSLWSLRNRLILAAVVLTALAISISDFAANTALRSYLISQVDQQLIDISGGSLTRLDRAGIEQDATEGDQSPFHEFRPLRGVPTSASVSLLDVDGNLIDLSPTEFLLLRYLMINADRVVSKAQILDHVWQYDFRGDMGIVETYVSYLRKKIDIYEPALIHTVRGVGYRLRLPASN